MTQQTALSRCTRLLLVAAICGTWRQASAAPLAPYPPLTTAAPLLPALAMPLVVAQADTPTIAAAQQPDATARDTSFYDDLFAGTVKFAKAATHATEINMSPDDLGEVRGPHAQRAHATLLNSVHEYEFDKPGMYSLADVDEFRRKLEGPGWHCSVHTRDLKTGGSTDVCSKRRADDLKESAIITVEPKELTFIHRIQRVSPHEREQQDHDSDSSD